MTADLDAEVAEKVMAALRFYADRLTYVSFPGDNDVALIEMDGGERARAALAAMEWK